MANEVIGYTGKDGSTTVRHYCLDCYEKQEVYPVETMEAITEDSLPVERSQYFCSLCSKPIQ